MHGPRTMPVPFGSSLPKPTGAVLGDLSARRPSRTGRLPGQESRRTESAAGDPGGKLPKTDPQLVDRASAGRQRAHGCGRAETRAKQLGAPPAFAAGKQDLRGQSPVTPPSLSMRADPLKIPNVLTVRTCRSTIRNRQGHLIPAALRASANMVESTRSATSTRCFTAPCLIHIRCWRSIAETSTVPR